MGGGNGLEEKHRFYPRLHKVHGVTYQYHLLKFIVVKEIPASTSHISLLPPANEVWGKVIFLHLSVILFTGGGGVLRGSAWSRPPRLLLRAVRILLECILVKNRLALKKFPEEQDSLRCDHRPGWCTAKHPDRTPPQEVQGQVNAYLQLQQNSVLSGPQLISQREICCYCINESCFIQTLQT